MANFLIFELSGIRGGLPVEDVREIVRAVEISPLPGAPSVVEGVINVRGNVVPVVSLRARLGFAPSAVDPSEHMIVISARQRDVALRVDRVVALEDIPAAEIAAPDAFTAAGWDVAGVAQLADGLIVIHDPKAFLSEAENVALGSALHGGASQPEVAESTA